MAWTSRRSLMLADLPHRAEARLRPDPERAPPEPHQDDPTTGALCARRTVGSQTPANISAGDPPARLAHAALQE